MIIDKDDGNGIVFLVLPSETEKYVRTDIIANANIQRKEYLPMPTTQYGDIFILLQIILHLRTNIWDPYQQFATTVNKDDGNDSWFLVLPFETEKYDSEDMVANWKYWRGGGGHLNILSR